MRILGLPSKLHGGKSCDLTGLTIDEAPASLYSGRFDKGSCLTTNRVEIDGAILKPRSGRLQGPRASVRLEPRVIQVAGALAESPGEVVTREQLIDSIWSGYPDADLADELLQALSRLRTSELPCAAAPARSRWPSRSGRSRPLPASLARTSPSKAACAGWTTGSAYAWRCRRLPIQSSCGARISSFPPSGSIGWAPSCPMPSSPNWKGCKALSYATASARRKARRASERVQSS